MDRCSFHKSFSHLIIVNYYYHYILVKTFVKKVDFGYNNNTKDYNAYFLKFIQ